MTAALESVRRRIARAGGDDVTLIAITKGRAQAEIAPLLAAGQCDFGENRVGEATTKWSGRERADVKLHLVGALQSNKAAEAAAFFDVIHTLDRPKLAAALAAWRDETGKALPQLFVQVNTGEEAQKSGVAPDEAEGFVAACRQDYGLEIAGLMCLPPRDAVAAPHFAWLKRLAQRLDLPMLSMGMSADFETAIAQGATHVRVGTALFD